MYTQKSPSTYEGVFVLGFSMHLIISPSVNVRSPVRLEEASKKSHRQRAISPMRGVYEAGNRGTKSFFKGVGGEELGPRVEFEVGLSPTICWMVKVIVMMITVLIVIVMVVMIVVVIMLIRMGMVVVMVTGGVTIGILLPSWQSHCSVFP
jgi:hypothetical protein